MILMEKIQILLIINVINTEITLHFIRSWHGIVLINKILNFNLEDVFNIKEKLFSQKI